MTSSMIQGPLSLRVIASVLLGLLACTARSGSADLPGRRPNILLIVADDLGWSDLGCYGGEIRTPHLDGLAAAGLRFTHFYNTGRCWPTRASILTGYYAQQVRRDTVPGVRSGGAGTRPAWAPLLPALLKPFGYRSYHSGKWHIDGPRLAAGFHRSYSVEDHDRYFGPRRHLLDDEPLPPVQAGDRFHVTSAIADRAIEFLEQHAREAPEQPFFQYLCFTAPHFPLQAPPEWIAENRASYRSGWDVIRAGRWERIVERGLVRGALSMVERAIGPPYHFPDALQVLGPGEVNRPLPWDSLTREQQEFQAHKMAIHAAMVQHMDQQIGRVLRQVRTMGAWTNTIVLFLSDNGASAEIMVRGDGHDPEAPPGSAASYLCLGPGWSTVANTPFRRHKTWMHEGGIATPLIVHWPARLRDAGGGLRKTPGHVIDLVPTLLELAGGDPDAVAPGAPPRPGMSLVPALAADGDLHREGLWWLHEGNRALRVGEWKIVAARDEPWALYHLGSDRAETRDLAAEHPDRLQAMIEAWERAAERYFEDARRDLTGQRAAAESSSDRGATAVRRNPLVSDSENRQ